MTETKKQWAGANKWDAFNSTFKAKIYLSNRQYPLTGYSKGLLAVEGPDKTIVLEGFISRLVKCGYLFGTHQTYSNTTLKIEYYLNGSYTGIPDELIFTLYPDEYVFEKNEKYLEDVRLHTSLKRLYKQAKDGEIVTKSLIHKKEFRSADELFSVEKKRFKNDMEVLDFMQTCIRDGHPRGIVFDFYTKYTAKWFTI